jgi:aspartate kinase
MQVYKFGGASIQHAEGIKNIGNIIKSFKEDHLLVVISALGHTTNKLTALNDASFWNIAGTFSRS